MRSLSYRIVYEFTPDSSRRPELGLKPKNQTGST
jgi:hypothetical protein